MREREYACTRGRLCAQSKCPGLRARARVCTILVRAASSMKHCINSSAAKEMVLCVCVCVCLCVCVCGCACSSACTSADTIPRAHTRAHAHTLTHTHLGIKVMDGQA